MAAATAKSVPALKQADYGLDAPKLVHRMFTRSAVLIVLGIAVWWMNREYNPQGGTSLMSVSVAIGLGFLGAGAFMTWCSRKGKLDLRDQILESLPWRGDEKVLDVGCGRGLMMIGAAKRLKTGKATGIDIWSAEDLSGNSADATVTNARAEGVMDRVKIENGDARRLQYQNNAYDVVLSSLCLHNVEDDTARTKALDEILRVTKPSGHIAIFDIFHADDYVKHFESAGAEIVKRSDRTWLWLVPGRWLIARKR